MDYQYFIFFLRFIYILSIFYSNNLEEDILTKFYYFLIGGFLFFLIGIHDDIFKSSPILRLFLQFGVAFFVSFNGINFNSLNFYVPYFWKLNIFLILFLIICYRVFGLLGSQNSINWLDGIDALAGGYSAILSLGLFLLMLIHGKTI